jgi:hypothetical protein
LKEEVGTGETTLIDVEGWEGMGVDEAVGVVGDCGGAMAAALDTGTDAAAGIEAATADASATWADVGAPTVPFDGDAIVRSSVIVYGGGGLSSDVGFGRGTCLTAARALAPVWRPFGDGRVYTEGETCQSRKDSKKCAPRRGGGGKDVECRTYLQGKGQCCR